MTAKAAPTTVSAGTRIAAPCSVAKTSALRSTAAGTPRRARSHWKSGPRNTSSSAKGATTPAMTSMVSMADQLKPAGAMA